MASQESAIVTMRSFGDLAQVGDAYRSRQPVDVSLRNADGELAMRVLDFASGLVHLDGGYLTRLDEDRYRLTPGDGSATGQAGDREPRTPHPVEGGASAVVPVVDGEPSRVDAVRPDGLVLVRRRPDA